MRYISLIALVTVLCLENGIAHAYDEADLQRLLDTNECQACDLSGAVLTDADLRAAHLTGADLRNADLAGADLRRADLTGADLSGAVLTGADLFIADLTDADLMGAHLSGAHLTAAYLTGAHLTAAHLTGADLRNADLAGADLRNADLAGADLSGAVLTDADLRFATLTGADLTGADLTGADLTGADLIVANLIVANLTGADLAQATLSDADLTGADLRNADLLVANLTGADLTFADFSMASFNQTVLSGAILDGTLLAGVRFDVRGTPDPNHVPSGAGLSTMTWQESSAGLAHLRSVFRNAGMRDAERQLTYAIMRGPDGAPWSFDQNFKWFFFDLTSAYGLEPARALWILLGLYTLFAIPYMVAANVPISEKAAIWRVWFKDESRASNPDARRLAVDARALMIPVWGLYFSLLSTFRIGWRDLNIGNWLSRLNPHDYEVQATGWVKVISGVQSLLSVYLIAIWALTYFGRPFE